MEAWAVVVAAALSSVFTLFGSTLIPFWLDTAKANRSAKRRKAADGEAKRAALLSIYASSRPYLTRADEPLWVNVVAAATDCIPYTGRDTAARRLVVMLAEREVVEVEELIDALHVEVPG